MPRIEFTIDEQTGELEMHVEGERGPACERVVDLLKEYVGEPTTEEKTAEYQLRPRAAGREQVRTKGGRG